MMKQRHAVTLLGLVAAWAGQGCAYAQYRESIPYRLPEGRTQQLRVAGDTGWLIDAEGRLTDWNAEELVWLATPLPNDDMVEILDLPPGVPTTGLAPFVAWSGPFDDAARLTGCSQGLGHGAYDCPEYAALTRAKEIRVLFSTEESILLGTDPHATGVAVLGEQVLVLRSDGDLVWFHDLARSTFPEQSLAFASVQQPEDPWRGAALGLPTLVSLDGAGCGQTPGGQWRCWTADPEQLAAAWTHPWTRPADAFDSEPGEPLCTLANSEVRCRHTTMTFPAPNTVSVAASEDQVCLLDRQGGVTCWQDGAQFLCGDTWIDCSAEQLVQGWRRAVIYTPSPPAPELEPQSQLASLSAGRY